MHRRSEVRAILKVPIGKDGEEKPIHERKLFDTDKMELICKKTNRFGIEIAKLYLSKSGVIVEEKKTSTGEWELEIPAQEKEKDYIAQNEVERYMELFGKVREG